MDELTPQQKEQLKNELTAYAREGATDEQLIAFKNKMIAGFEAQNASTVKKKDGLGQFGGSFSGAQSKKQPAIPTGVIESGLPSVSKSGSSSSGNGTDISFMGDTLSGDENNGQQSSEPIFGSIGKAIKNVANSRPTDTGDIIVPYKNGVSKKIYKDGYEELITETGEVQPVIKFSGGEIPISKAAIPDGYTKDVIGAKKYAYDLGIKIKAAQSSGDQATLQQVGNELGLIETFNRTTNHESILSSEELKGINSLIPSIGSTAFDKPTPELYSSLIDKQRQIKERIDAENAKKIDEFKPTSADIKAGYTHKLGLKKYEDDPEYKQTEEYIKKVSRGLTKVVDQTASDEASVVNADMRSNYNKLFTSIPGEIKNIVSREHPERLNNLFLTGVESLYWSDRNRYQSIKKRLAQNKTLASVEVAELTSIGASIADADNLQKLKNKEIDQGAFNKNEEDLAKKLYDNFYKRPDILNSSIAKAIGEYHASAKRSTGSRIANTIFGEWEITDKEIDQVPSEWFQKYGIDITMPEAQEQLEAIKREEGPIILQNAVPKDGLTREFFKGAAQPIRGAIDFFKISNDSNADLVNYKLQGLSRTAEERTKYFNKHYGTLADAFNGFGQFATQYLMMEAGAGLVGSTPSKLMVPYIQSYDQNYKRGLEATGDPWKARVYGVVNSAMEALSEQMFDNLEFGRKVINNFKGKHSIDDIVSAIGKGEIKTMVESGLRNSINAVKESVKGFVSESFEEVPVAISTFISDAVSNPQQMQDRELFTEAKDAFLSGMVSFSIPSLLGLSARLSNNNNRYTDEEVKNNMLRLAVSNRIAVRDAINNQLSAGTINQKEANEKLQTLNTAVKVAETMPQVYADGREMSEQDKVKFLSLRVQEKYLIDENDRSDDDAVKVANEEKLKAINDQKLSIIKSQIQNIDLESSYTEVSAEDKSILDELRDKSDEFTKKESLSFFIDQAASAPATFQEKYGADALNALLPRASMKQLASALTIMNKVGDADNPNIGLIENEIGRREAVLEQMDNTISISDVMDKPAIYKGQEGKLYQDGQAVVFAVNDSNREYELGNVDEIKGQSIKDWGIEEIHTPAEAEKKSVVATNETGEITVRGITYKNNYSNPTAAINRDEEGNVISVNLETEEGKKRTFRGDVAEDIAYQIHLKQLNQDNETAAQFEQFIEEDEPSRSEIVAAENEGAAKVEATSDNEEVPRQKIEPKPRIRVTAQQVEEGQNNDSQLKQNQNAIPQQTTTESVLRNQGIRGEGGLQEVEQDNQPEVSASEVQSEKKVGDIPPTAADISTSASDTEAGSGITHAITAETREEFGLPEYEKTSETVEDWDAEATKRITNGEMPSLISRMERGYIPNHIEQRMMGKYIASLEAKAAETMANEDIAALHYAIKLSDKIGGSDWGRSGVARKGIQVNDESLGGFFVREMESLKIDELPESVKERLAAEYSELSKAKAEYETKMAELEAAEKLLQAQKGFEALKKSKSSKKANVDYAAKRKKILDDMKEKLRQSRGDTSVAIVPYAKELFIAAPYVGKYVAVLVEQGVTKFGDVVQALYDDLRVAIPEITQDDVHDLLAGEYNKRDKKTKGEIQARMADIKREAQLFNQLDAIYKKEFPKNEKEEIERSKLIKFLKDQLKDALKNSSPGQYQSMINKYNNEYKKLEAELSSGDYIQDAKKTPLLNNSQLKKQFPDEYKGFVEARDRVSELRQIREVRIMAQEYAARSRGQKIRDAILEVLNVPRTIMASMDFSAPLRQGIVATASHPGLALKAFGEMFNMAFSTKRFDRWFQDLQLDPRYDAIVKSGLAVTDPHDYRLSSKEEQFMNNLAGKIPIIGRAIKGSERAYVGFLNKMRVDVFNRYIDPWISEGKTFDTHPEDYKALASFVNNMTGRGKMASQLEQAAPLLNTMLFSPRLIASRLNLLNPYYYYKLPKEIRVIALKDMAKFMAVGGLTIGLFAMNGADVEDDPRSSDWGKIRYGNSRWDIWGGFQQYIRMGAQLFTGKRETATTGKIKDANQGDTFFTFARGKLAPVPSMLVNLGYGKNLIGEEVTWKSELKAHLVPLIYSDIKTAFKEDGVESVFKVGLPAMFGVGVSTFPTKKD